MAAPVTAPRLLAMKAEGARIVCLTAYDATTGRLADQAGVDVVLVGDSLGNVVQGHQTTVPVTLEEMAYHVRAVRKSVSRALLVADMPFGSYGSSVAQAVDSAVVLAKAGAEAVKLEGPHIDAVQAIQAIGLPVMGHVGMTPQSVNAFGGFRVQGRGEEGDSVLAAARALDEAGVFSIVLELIPADLAQRITGTVRSATIGIGAGPGCDGEIQVFHDLTGLAERAFKHTKCYLEGGPLMSAALRAYTEDVRARRFPSEENSA